MTEIVGIPILATIIAKVLALVEAVLDHFVDVTSDVIQGQIVLNVTTSPYGNGLATTIGNLILYGVAFVQPLLTGLGAYPPA